jgi:PilZ domain
MAEQKHEGVAYLLALKQSSQADPATAPAANLEMDFQGTNKRRAPRFKCEGSVEIREDGCEVRTWATFTDISLHGCYVEAQATYPAGSILNMKLEANGVRVETRGNVRVNYPYLGMGIAFVGMTEENVARLRQMLATISRGCVIVGPGIASTLPSTGSLSALPVISNPAAAIQELTEFFESRQMLMREDFLRILRKSQATTKA